MTTQGAGVSRDLLHPPGPGAARRILALAAVIALFGVAGTLAVAIVTRVAFAEVARSWLDYRFPGLPANGGTAVSIFANNATALLGVLGLLLIAQLAARHSPGRLQRAVQACGEILLAGEITANVLILGCAIGAYGTRLLEAIVPHGPIELIADALMLALYRHGRRRALPARQIAGTIAASLGLLAIAAALEAFVTL